jgi:hypothetical protein
MEGTEIRQILRIFATSCSFSLLLLSAPGPARAYPIVVRAGSRIELAMRHEGTRMAIDGRLQRDDGAPLADMRVVLTVGTTQAATLQTDAEGRFGWAGELPFGQYDVVASFVGRQEVDGSTEGRRFDFGRADVALDLALPARIDRARQSVELEVRARSESGGGNLGVELLDRAGRTLARAVTNGTGLARLSLVPRALGPPGPIHLEVRSTADALRGAGHDTGETILVSRSRLALWPVAETVPADGDLVLVGAVSDEQHPIARGAIEVQVGRTPAIRTSTDDRGVFTATIPFEGLPRGVLEVGVAYRPDADWRLPAAIGPLRIDHLAPTPLPLWLLLVSIGVTAIALALVLRSARDRRGAAARRARAQPPARVHGGLQASRSSESRVRASRRPPDPEIAGRVVDATTRKGVGGAVVAVTLAGEMREIACDPSGRFATGPLPAGEATVSVAASAYLPETFVARIPHAGELRDVRVELVPVRHRVMEIYRDAALRVLPERDLWGFWTPRELLRFVKKRHEARQPPLAPLTELFEEVYYAGRGARVEQVTRAAELAAAIGARAPQ